MKYTIENNNIKVVINSLGAELDNLIDKSTGREYIWQKDKEFWGKSSPVLFPFVGSIKNEEYQYKNKKYEIKTRHGFARDNEFKVSNQGENFIEFSLESNEDTLKVYPFKFNLFMKYTIEGRNLEINYRVENKEEGEMYFSIGAHPAFALDKEETYFLEFENEEEGRIKTIENGLISEEKEINLKDNKIIPLEKETFKEDALIFENTHSKKLWIKNGKNDKIVEMSYEGFRYMAFWNVVGSGFICLEPWDGITDYKDSDGELTTKVGIQKLEKNETYSKSINIKI